MLKIYKASAGSGKTFTLTRDYLTLLLGYQDKTTGKWKMHRSPVKAHRHVLAITFTNKATDEMVERIIKELARLGNQGKIGKEDSKYLDYFADLFDEPKEKVEELAARVLFDLLFDYAYFHVSTIDAFFQNVIRTFAREIELPDDFGVELNDQYIVALGVSEMFSNLNNFPHAPENVWLQKILTRFINRNFQAGNPINIFSRNSRSSQSITDSLNRIINEDFKIAYENFLPYLQNLNKLIDFGASLDTSVAKIIHQVETKAASLMRAGDFEGINNYVRGHIIKIAAGDWSSTAATPEKVAKNEARWDNVGYWKKLKTAPDPTLEALTRDYCQSFVHARAISHEWEVIRPGIELLGILACVLTRIEEFCRERGIIQLSSANTLLHDIINDEETPFVYERLGYYLNHFLIDEFQDTSRMQWENLRPMVNESMSNANFNLIIGDEKQCIYRFRNSDPELLGSQVSDYFTRRALPVGIEGNRVDQNTNWRSHEHIVKFNNTLFRGLGRKINLADTYDTAVQAVSPEKRGTPGFVKLQFFEKLTTAQKSEMEDGDGALHPLAVRAAVDDVTRLLRAGVALRDICILVRTHAQGEQIIRALLKIDDPSLPKIEISSGEAMSISMSSAVQLIIGTLRMLITPREVIRNSDAGNNPLNPQKGLSQKYRLTRLTRWYHHYIQETASDDPRVSRVEALSKALAKVEEETRDYRNQGNGTASHALAQELKLHPEDAVKASSATSPDGTTDSDSDTFAPLDYFSLDALVDLILQRFVPEATIKRETLFLNAFHDLLSDYREFGNDDIREFLEFWDTTGKSAGVQSSADAEAIKVMTIHASKGLEFPYVIIPCADWTLHELSSAFKPKSMWVKLDADIWREKGMPEVDPETIPMMLPLALNKALVNSSLFSPQALENLRQQDIDSLNVAYVAFTRATKWLAVYGKANFNLTEKDATAHSTDGLLLSDLIIDVITSTNGDSISAELAASVTDTVLRDELARWLVPLSDKYILTRPAAESLNPGDTTGNTTTAKSDEAAQPALADIKFEWGHENDVIDFIPPQKKEASEEQPKEDVVEKSADTKSWRPILEDAKMDFKPGLGALANFRTTADIELRDFNDPRWLGSFIHRILSRLSHPDRMTIEVERACHRANLTPEQSSYIYNVLDTALSDPRARSWFTGYSRVANERTLLCENSRTHKLETRRADRIVWHSDGSIDVIDYKSGDVDEATYRRQVAQYVRGVRRAFPEAVVRGYLWFLTQGRIDQVDA